MINKQASKPGSSQQSLHMLILQPNASLQENYLKHDTKLIMNFTGPEKFWTGYVRSFILKWRAKKEKQSTENKKELKW